MAQKRFSRLSVMLEARDRMSRPLQAAARASQNLQSSVTRLNGSLVRNSDGYRRMTERVTKAKNSILQLANVVARTAKESAAAYAATKALSASYKFLSVAVQGTAYYLKLAGTRFKEFITNSKAFRTVSSIFRTIKNDVKLVGMLIGNAVTKTKLWQKSGMLLVGTLLRLKMTKIVVKDIATTMAKAALNTVKSSKAFQLLNRSIGSTKRSIAAARLSFELFKNSSQFVQRLSNDVKKVGRGFTFIGQQVRRVLPSFSSLTRNIQTANQRMGQLGGRRATFNQLADANARLNREITKMNRELQKANSRLGSMKSSMGSLNHMGAAFGAAYAAQAAGQTVGNVAKSTVGVAMEQQYSSASVGILAGPEKGAKFYKQIQDYAAATAYSTEDWARNMRGAISKSKNIKDLEQYQVAIEQLATLDPVQGLDGAALAIRELNSGDITSLVERFELPRTALKQIKGIEDPIEQIGALMKIVGDNTGYTVENIQKMKELPLMQWQKFSNHVKTAMGYIGKASLEKLAPLFEKFNKAWDEGKFEPIIKLLNDGLGNFTQGLIDLSANAGTHIDNLKKKFAPLIELWGNVKATFVEAWPSIKQVLSDFQTAGMGIVTVINDNWPTINGLIQTAVDTLAGITTWAVEHWPQIKGAILGLATAIATWKILTWATTVINLWRNGMLIATIAEWAMNTALWTTAAAVWAALGPVVLIIAAIAALAAIFVYAYNNNKTFHDAVNACFSWIRDVGAAAIDVGKAAIDGLASAFKTAWEWVGNLWDKFSGFIDKVKNTKINWSGILPGGESFINFGGKGKSHHGGLDRVPYDGYQATLHKGEKVLTRNEVRNGEGQGSGVSVTGNTFIVRQDSDIDAIADALYTKLNSAKVAMG